MKRRYSVVIQKGDEDEGYGGYVVGVSVYTSADTSEKVLENLRAALEAHLAELRAEGSPIPEPPAITEVEVEVA